MSPQGPGFAPNPAMAGNGRYRRNSMPTGAAMGPGAMAPRSMPAPDPGFVQDPMPKPMAAPGMAGASGGPQIQAPTPQPMQRPAAAPTSGGPQINPVTPGAPTQQPQRMPAPWTPPSSGPQAPGSPQSLRQQGQANQNRQLNTF